MPQNASVRVIPGLSALTPREREMLRLLGRGLDCDTISQRLGLSHRTAETLCQTVMRKLNFPTQEDLARYAARLQW